MKVVTEVVALDYSDVPKKGTYRDTIQSELTRRSETGWRFVAGYATTFSGTGTHYLYFERPAEP